LLGHDLISTDRHTQAVGYETSGAGGLSHDRPPGKRAEDTPSRKYLLSR
jgi:hypothetical protein